MSDEEEYFEEERKFEEDVKLAVEGLVDVNQEINHQEGGDRIHDDKGESVPLWLITFTDVMALMLTFFVLLYSMSVPQEEKWEQISNAISTNFTKLEAKPYNTGSQDVIAIDKINKSKALDLGYLEVVVNNYIEANKIKNIIVFQNANSLILSLPSDLLFKSGSAEVNLKGKKMLFSLGGVLSRVKNRIEIVGHTDPRPIIGESGIYQNNWELSLARSSAVAMILNNVGYDKSIVVRGVSSARFDELSNDISEEERYNLSRRVDIVLMDDDGTSTRFLKMQ